MAKYTIGFIGTGNMGGALIRAACKGIDPKQVLITNHTLDKAKRLADEVGCDVVLTNEEVVRQCKFIMLGVKPQVLPAVLQEIAPAVKACMRDCTSAGFGSLLGSWLSSCSRISSGRLES